MELLEVVCRGTLATGSRACRPLLSCALSLLIGKDFEGAVGADTKLPVDGVHWQLCLLWDGGQDELVVIARDEECLAYLMVFIEGIGVDGGGAWREGV